MEASATMERWFSLEVEVPLDGVAARSYAEATATPFFLLNEPVRSELLYAIQQRDMAGTAMLDPVAVRSMYSALRRNETASLVGLDQLGLPWTQSNRRGLLREVQARIDGAHRSWSGTSVTSDGVIYLSDLVLRPGSKAHGLHAKVNISGIHEPWIRETVASWAYAAARTSNKLLLVAKAWTVVDEVIRDRSAHAGSLTRADMDAVHRRILQRWPTAQYQRRLMTVVREVSEYARDNMETLEAWRRVPGAFSVDRVRHQPNGILTSSAANADEPFRFVPQPVVDWVMDHIALYSRRTAYQTAEARVMIFLQERCGRRTGETVKLRNDCISYDDAGAPYLEWQEGKPPYGWGKRLPIHPETHDVIRDWQALKVTVGIESEWLFPSFGRDAGARHRTGSFLAERVREFMEVIAREAPFSSSVLGAEGNLVHFDVRTIDPYSFRHAFAQRLADAEDADGRSTTPPDVLQDFMGHKSFNTTMAYYQVTAKRRKRALAAISPRRLDITGAVVPFDNERAAFGKLAVSLGTCTEPANVKSGGEACLINHACESCPFFLVDPLERDGITSKRLHLKAQRERFSLIAPGSHMVSHLENRIDDCDRIVEGIDRYIGSLPEDEQRAIRDALDTMEDVRRRASAPRTIDIRAILLGSGNG
ncbi:MULTISPECIES: site-specific integrase [unclassified Microbacterium]|uniref:site-specific integrase n=1 Tax=unclassified Microbacterium TaxID=2609290 RepID=UPI0016036360|nr:MULTISPECIES: site-specific integrase [unclassified Microbacterium]MBT2486726.1 site-specific integrase [Microbacterium sp. ISL-108]